MTASATAKPGSHCSVEIRQVGDVCHLRLSGVIDETFEAMAAPPSKGHLLVDVGQISRITSYGVRNWINWLSGLPAPLKLYLVNAPPVMLDQLNMVAGFAGRTQVVSLLAPYTCQRCGAEGLRRIDLASEQTNLQAGKVPPATCGECRGPMELSEPPLELFSFLAHLSTGELPGRVEQYLELWRGEEPAPNAGHQKIVDERVTFIQLVGPLGEDLNLRRLSAGLEGAVAYDFSRVTELKDSAVEKLGQLLGAAASAADVYLWRMPASMLQKLNGLSPRPKAQVATLWEPRNCFYCGSRVPELISAREYQKWLKDGAALEKPCQVCGRAARLRLNREVGGYLEERAASTIPLQLPAISEQALEQHLGAIVQEDTYELGEPLEMAVPQLEILRPIGQGGMAEVFLARQVGVKGLEKYVALKKVLSQYAEQEKFIEMLFAEARANARLTHPNIVQTFDAGMLQGSAYITMEYVRGPDLKRLLVLMQQQGIKLPLEHALRVVAETANGLHYAHNYVDPSGAFHPMIHRDVSPHNILISLDGAIKLSDFGIAKALNQTESTEANIIKGKIGYVTPEAITGQPLDQRNDVFSLGVTLFELLLGRLPFERSGEAASLRAIVYEPAPVPAKLDPSIPQEVSDLILRALEKEPAKRIASAGQFRDEVERVMQRLGLSSTPVQVAQFFQQKLGAQLASFVPVTPPQSATPVPTTSGDTELAGSEGTQLLEVAHGATVAQRAPTEPSPTEPEPEPEPEPQTQPLAPAAPAPMKRSLLLAMGAGGVAVLAVLVWLLAR